MALAYLPPLSTYWGAGAFFYFLTQILRTRNRGGAAHLGAAYVVGMEVLLRMTGASLFWEFGKLACIALIGLALLVQASKPYRWHYLLLLLVFVPSLFLATDLPLDRYRQMITFQLGGMILLLLSATYFSGQVFNRVAWQRMLRYMLYPVASMVAYLFLRTPSLADIHFTTGANFATSAGFGPNQVSTILGLGMFVLLLNYLLRFPPLFSASLDKLFFAVLTFRALLTFSRGGVVAALVAILLAYLLYLPSTRVKNIGKTVFRFLLGMLIFIGLFLLTDQLTGNLLSMRYEGKRLDTAEYSIDKVSSGRSKILETDWLMFLDHPLLGVGLGESNVLRPAYGYRNISHLEQSRLLSEHGVLGLLLLLWLVFQVAEKSTLRQPHLRFIAFGFALLAFLTMFHSATRLAMTGFCFGLAFLKLQEYRSGFAAAGVNKLKKYSWVQ